MQESARVLADAAGRAAWSGDAAGGWRPRREADLPPALRRLCRALRLGPPTWAAAAPALPGGGFWSDLLLVGEAPRSQFDVLRELVAAAPGAAGDPLAAGPIATVALAGSGFHGHRGRPWRALAGNLHLCAALRTDLPAASCGLPLTVLPVVAAADAVAAVTDGRLPVGIKWVNDLLAGGRKLAGSIATTQSRAGRLELAILGLGVDLAVAPALPPGAFVPGAACLREFPSGRSVTLPALLRAVLAALAARLRQLEREGPEPLLATYREHSAVVGRRVRIYPEGLDEGDPAGWPPALAEGRVLGIGPDLALRLEGRAEPVDRGRLVLLDG